jgi:hypothetical protein
MNIDNELIKVVTELNPVLTLNIECDVRRKLSEGFGKSFSHYLILVRVKQSLN